MHTLYIKKKENMQCAAHAKLEGFFAEIKNKKEKERNVCLQPIVPKYSVLLFLVEVYPILYLLQVTDQVATLLPGNKHKISI